MPTTFALIDLDSHKILGTHSLSGGIRCIALDDKYVYVIPVSVHALYRFDRTDLSKLRRFFLGSIPERLVATPDKQIAVQLGGGPIAAA